MESTGQCQMLLIVKSRAASRLRYIKILQLSERLIVDLGPYPVHGTDEPVREVDDPLLKREREHVFSCPCSSVVAAFEVNRGFSGYRFGDAHTGEDSLVNKLTSYCVQPLRVMLGQ